MPLSGAGPVTLSGYSRSTLVGTAQHSDRVRPQISPSSVRVTGLGWNLFLPCVWTGSGPIPWIFHATRLSSVRVKVMAPQPS